MRTDFAIIAPLDEEIEQLLAAFGVPPQTKPKPSPGQCQYYEALLDTGTGTTRVHIVKLAKQGVLNTAVAATQLILAWRPWCVVSFGIAGGFINTGDIGIGDVFVPDAVFYYEPAKDAPRGKRGAAIVEPRPIVFEPDPNLSTLIATGESYRVVTGVLASGERKIAASGAKTRKELGGMHGKILGIEMESAGVGAAHQGTAGAVNGNVRFLVVKGISDDASDKEHRERNPARDNERLQAAKNAALYLRRVVELAKPQRHEEYPRINITRTHEIAREFIAASGPREITETINELDLQRCVHPIEALPPVFYHWRALDVPVHWVELMQFSIFRRLATLGFPIHLLVDDLGHSVDHAKARRNTERMVDSVIGSASIHWLRDIIDHDTEYLDYANALGFRASAHEALINDEAPRGSGRWQFQQWLPYIAWISRAAQRCIVSVWTPQKDYYDVLKQILPLQPFFVYRPDYGLAGQPGKLTEPGSSLHVEPPSYPAITSWLSNDPDPRAITDLNRFLSFACNGASGTADAMGAVLDGAPELRARLSGNDERAHAVAALLQTLGALNTTYFSSWVEEQTAAG